MPMPAPTGSRPATPARRDSTSVGLGAAWAGTYHRDRVRWPVSRVAKTSASWSFWTWVSPAAPSHATIRIAGLPQYDDDGPLQPFGSAHRACRAQPPAHATEPRGAGARACRGHRRGGAGSREPGRPPEPAPRPSCGRAGSGRARPDRGAGARARGARTRPARSDRGGSPPCPAPTRRQASPRHRRRPPPWPRS